MERYGTMNFFNNEKVKEKYGVDNYAKTPQWKEQRAKTCMERYGTKNFFNQDKIKQQYGGIGFGGTMVSKIKKKHDGEIWNRLFYEGTGYQR